MENSCIISIPDRLSVVSVDGIYQAAQAAREDNMPIFDFTKVNFVTPESLILLVTSSQSIHKQYGCVVKWQGIKGDVLGYMDRMNINDFDFININRPSIFKRRDYKKSDALVELSLINNAQQIGSAILQTKQVLNEWFPSSDNGCRQHLLTLIKETVENSVEHSSEEPSNGSCYYVLQKYNRPNGLHEVQIAVGDVGVGMLSSQRRVHSATKDDAEAIMEALMNGRSGRALGGGGMGYVNIREALAPLQGQITIRSGRAHLEHQAGAGYARIVRHTCSCPGTQIIFKCRA